MYLWLISTPVKKAADVDDDFVGVGVCVSGGGCGGSCGGGVGGGGGGGFECIIIFNFHELRCNHNKKYTEFEK